MNETMLKRLTLKASKQLMADASKGYVEIKKQGGEIFLKLHRPLKLKDAIGKVEKSEGHFSDLCDNATGVLAEIKKIGNSVLSVLGELVAVIQWNQKNSKIAFYSKSENDLYVKTVKGEKTIYGTIRGTFDPDESAVKRELDKFTKI